MTDKEYKICISGDGGVGKTTITHKFLTGVFQEDTKLTIGTNIYKKKLVVEDGPISINIWDLGGERKFRTFIPTYIKGASGVMLIYDITRNTSLNNIAEWMTSMRQGLGKKIQIPLLMVGNKYDLEYKRAFDKEIPNRIAKEHGFFKHMECSAKTGYNIEEIFTTLILQIMSS